jgi:hypothetical protein
MPSPEELLNWMTGGAVKGMPSNPRKKKKKVKRKARRGLSREDTARKAGVDLDKMKAATAKHDPRYTVSINGEDAVLNFGKNKGYNVSSLVETDPQYLRWMLTQEFPPPLVDVIKYQLKIPSAEAGAELHGTKEAPPRVLKSSIKSLDGTTLADWPDMVKVANPTCPTCHLSYKDSYGFTPYVLSNIEQYVFSCNGCGKAYKYSYKKRKTYPV